MKKTYIQPSILLTALSMHKMVCVSEPRVTINTSEEIEAAGVESRRRHNNVWGDEEDDDYGSLY